MWSGNKQSDSDEESSSSSAYLSEEQDSTQEQTQHHKDTIEVHLKEPLSLCNLLQPEKNLGLELHDDNNSGRCNVSIRNEINAQNEDSNNNNRRVFWTDKEDKTNTSLPLVRLTESSAIGMEDIDPTKRSSSGNRKSVTSASFTRRSTLKEYTSTVNATNMTVLVEHTFSDVPLICKASKNCQYFAIGFCQGVIRIYKSDTTDLNNSDFVLHTESEQLPCTDLEFFPTAKGCKENKHFILAAYASGNIRLWHYHGATNSARLVREWRELKFNSILETMTTGKDYNQILTCSLSKDRLRFVTGGEDCTIRVYEFTNHLPIKLCRANRTADRITGHAMRITALQYHPLGESNNLYCHIFVSASWDNSIQIWDDRFQYSIWSYHGPHICGTDGFDIDPIGNTIVTSSWSRDIALLQIWRFNHHVTEFTGTTISLDEDERRLFEKPRAEFFNDSPNLPTMGYVAQWINGFNHIIYAGSNENILKIVSKSSFETIGSLSNLPYGVYTACCLSDSQQQEVNKKGKLKILVCAEKCVYIASVDKK